MFNNKLTRTFQNGVNINSTAVDYLHVDVMRGRVVCLYKTGGVYDYTNVSRRACLKFILDEARSLGKFVNNVLLNERCNVKQWLTVSDYATA